MEPIVFLTALAFRLPLFLAWLVGIVLSIVFWKRNPKVSLLTLIAILLMACISTISTIASSAAPMMAEQFGMRVSQIGYIFGVTNIITIVAETISWGLVLGAIFGWRKPPVETETGPSVG